MNLSREALKDLIHESLQELSQEKQPEGGAKVPNLENIEKEVTEALGKFLNGSGSSIVQKVQRAATTLEGKARMVTLIAEMFGIKALDTKGSLAKASDSLTKPKPGSKSPKV